MRTARLLTVSRSIPCILGGGVCLTPTWMQIPTLVRRPGGSAQPSPLDADPHPRRQTGGSAQPFLWMQIPLAPLDVDPLDVDPQEADSPGHVTCDACWEANPFLQTE